MILAKILATPIVLIIYYPYFKTKPEKTKMYTQNYATTICLKQKTTKTLNKNLILALSFPYKISKKSLKLQTIINY